MQVSLACSAPCLHSALHGVRLPECDIVNAAPSALLLPPAPGPAQCCAFPSYSLHQAPLNAASPPMHQAPMTRTTMAPPRRVWTHTLV